MTNTSQPQEDKQEEQTFLDDYLQEGEPAFLAVATAVSRLSEKYNLPTDHLTRMLLASIATTGVHEDCADIDIAQFAIDLSLDIMDQWRALGNREGFDRFPRAQVYPEAKRFQDLSTSEYHRVIASLENLSTYLLPLIARSTDVIANKLNTCGCEMFVTFLLSMLTSTLVRISDSKESFQDKVDLLTSDLSQAWDKGQEKSREKSRLN